MSRNAALHYCDYNAGAPLRPQALEAMTRALAEGGNPSSIHRIGRRAKAQLEASRERIAAAIGARVQDVTFVSGATEGLHLALAGARSAAPDLRLIVSAIEHDALAEGARALWPAVETAPVDAHGVIDLAALERMLADGPPALVCVMAANNETGAIQPIAHAARLAHAARGLLLVDAAQALGRIPIDMMADGADYLVVSSHKIGGPPGMGALALTPGAAFKPPRAGGGQERGVRPGTENLAGAVGFAAACEAALAEADGERLAALRDDFERRLRALDPEVAIFAARAPRLANTSAFALPGLAAETTLIALDLAGIAVSSGAACSSGKVRASRVLRAMDVGPARAACALRVSFGWASSARDVDALIDALGRIVERARAPMRREGSLG